MPKFEASKFVKHGIWLYYDYEGENKFIARFKHRGPVTMAKLKKMLVKYYTVEEYLERVKKEAPLEILSKDGHLIFDREKNKFILDGKEI